MYIIILCACLAYIIMHDATTDNTARYYGYYMGTMGITVPSCIVMPISSDPIKIPSTSLYSVKNSQ